ncbi:MAG: hypothetical protein ACN4F8_00750 [Hydrogenophaga sp.]
MTDVNPMSLQGQGRPWAVDRMTHHKDHQTEIWVHMVALNSQAGRAQIWSLFPAVVAPQGRAGG